MRMFRNVCAHNEVVYNYKLVGYHLRAIEVSSLFAHYKIPFNKKKGIFERNTNNLFALIVIFKTMLPKNQFNEFIDQYTSSLKIINTMNPIILKKIQQMIGVPENYRDLKGL